MQQETGQNPAAPGKTGSVREIQTVRDLHGWGHSSWLRLLWFLLDISQRNKKKIRAATNSSRDRFVTCVELAPMVSS